MLVKCDSPTSSPGMHALQRVRAMREDEVMDKHHRWRLADLPSGPQEHLQPTPRQPFAPRPTAADIQPRLGSRWPQSLPRPEDQPNKFGVEFKIFCDFVDKVRISCSANLVEPQSPCRSSRIPMKFRQGVIPGINSLCNPCRIRVRLNADWTSYPPARLRLFERAFAGATWPIEGTSAGPEPRLRGTPPARLRPSRGRQLT